jgi:hypothetical protein
MSLFEWVAVIQMDNGPQPQRGSSTAADYIAIALVAAVLGLVVLIFIRTSARRSSKR